MASLMSVTKGGIPQAMAVAAILRRCHRCRQNPRCQQSFSDSVTETGYGADHPEVRRRGVVGKIDQRVVPLLRIRPQLE